MTLADGWAFQDSPGCVSKCDAIAALIRFEGHTNTQSMRNRMPNLPTLSSLDLAALLASRVCHDIISPVGALANGLEVLEELRELI